MTTTSAVSAAATATAAAEGDPRAVPSASLDVEPEFIEFYRRVQPHTMVGVMRMYSLYKSMQYVIGRNLPGDFVECGVYKGGCCMMMALTLQSLGAGDRRIHLLDTYAGMSEPGPKDVSIDGRKVARDLWPQHQVGDHNEWCYGGLDEVRQNMLSTGYDPAHLVFVEGRTEDTLPAAAPERIALLRLDTDWYASTLHELTHLYPRLVPDGVLISDDYAHWRGHREAIDGYLRDNGIVMLLTRTACGAVGIKPRELPTEQTVAATP